MAALAMGILASVLLYPDRLYYDLVKANCSTIYVELILKIPFTCSRNLIWYTGESHEGLKT